MLLEQLDQPPSVRDQMCSDDGSLDGGAVVADEQIQTFPRLLTGDIGRSGGEGGAGRRRRKRKDSQPVQMRKRLTLPSDSSPVG